MGQLLNLTEECWKTLQALNGSGSLNEAALHGPVLFRHPDLNPPAFFDSQSIENASENWYTIIVRKSPGKSAKGRIFLVLHLGADWVVPHRHVLAIIDLSTADNPDTRAFLRLARQQKAVIAVPEGEPRSAVIAVDDAGARRVYLSPISAATLRERNLLTWK